MMDSILIKDTTREQRERTDRRRKAIPVGGRANVR